MSTVEEFTPIGEVIADARSRITFGKAKVHADERFLVSRNEATGEIRMIPAVSIPASEVSVWQNPTLLNSIIRGLHQAANGEVVRMDHLFEDEDDDKED